MNFRRPDALFTPIELALILGRLAAWSPRAKAIDAARAAGLDVHAYHQARAIVLIAQVRHARREAVRRLGEWPAEGKRIAMADGITVLRVAPRAAL